MKANELRLGNYLTDRIHRTILVSEIRPEHLVFYLGNGTKMKHHINTFSPIPLTEEYHNKFGVKKDGFNSFVYILPRKLNINIKIVFQGDYVFLRQGNGSREDDVVSVWNSDLAKRDMYVHEFQNLYFALTNKELTIK